MVFKRDAVIGVCTDGTLVSAGNVKSFTNSETQAEEFEAERAKMRDAVQIDGGLSTVLKRDGTVENWWNKWEWDASLVQGYHDVVKIAGYSGSMFFLHEDGTVTHAYVGEDLETVVDIGWKDIVDILYYGPMIIGLDKNGTVRGMDIDTGESSTIWENMKKITTSGRRLFGISETGEVVGTLITKVYSYVGLYRVRNFMECQRETTPFMDEPIIEALWGIGEEVGLRSDGTLTVKDYDGDDVSSKYPWNLLPKRRVDIVPETVEVDCGAQQRLPLDFDWIDRKTVEWESDNIGIVTVDPSGMLKALRPGTATVTARSTVDNTAVDTVTVTVKDDGLDHGPVVETNTEGKIQVAVKSNAYSGEAYVLAGYSKNGKCIGTKVIPVTLTGGETASVEVPIIANCDAVRLYTWTKEMQPLSYPSVVPIISSIGG